MRLQHCIGARDFSRALLEDLFTRANVLRDESTDVLRGKILATLFYEPSTRTRLSFESAMIRLGGQVISTENAKDNSSVAKGESLEDTIRIIAGYAHAIVMRHHETGAAARAVAVSSVPIINGGDGKGEHPTQSLLDVYTMSREFGKVDGLRIAMVGDLSAGRTVRSLCYALANFRDVEITFVSAENLRMGEDVKQYIAERGVKFSESNDFDAVIPEVDVVYMTRLQKERLGAEDYQAAKGKFVIDAARLALVTPNARVMHPLPHVEEIDLPDNVENQDLRVAYFRQSANGVYARMALLDHLLRK